jgi:hypothetical protein
MSREGRFAGHRIAELQLRVRRELAQVGHLIDLNNKHQALLIKSLQKGRGVPRRNRKLAY